VNGIAGKYEIDVSGEEVHLVRRRNYAAGDVAVYIETDQEGLEKNDGTARAPSAVLLLRRTPCEENRLGAARWIACRGSDAMTVMVYEEKLQRVPWQPQNRRIGAHVGSRAVTADLTQSRGIVIFGIAEAESPTWIAPGSKPFPEGKPYPITVLRRERMTVEVTMDTQRNRT
jgi:hypothetical protein